MSRYGKTNCKHEFVYCTDGYVEECIAVICRKCGAFGCVHDMPEPWPSKEEFFKNGLTLDANINGQWKNPYVDRKRKSAKT